MAKGTRTPTRGERKFRVEIAKEWSDIVYPWVRLVVGFGFCFFLIWLLFRLIVEYDNPEAAMSIGLISVFLLKRLASLTRP